MSGHYLLGVTPAEVRRLDFQESVWGPMTAAALARLGVRSPWRCLDVGAGIGCVSVPLARRVAPKGKVTAVEPSAGNAAELRRRAAEAGLSNLEVLEASLAELRMKDESFDLILCRWVFLFIADIEAALKRLVPLLRPGGVLLIEDYHDYEGMTLHPRCPEFAPVIAAARRWFLGAGGGLQVAGRLPRLYRKLGLELIEFRPNIQTGAGSSDLFVWADLFFMGHLDSMVATAGLAPKDAAAFRKAWRAAARRPETRFVSPIVFDAAGRRPR